MKKLVIPCERKDWQWYSWIYRVPIMIYGQ